MQYLQLSLTVDRQYADQVSALFEEQEALSIMIESANDEACFDAAEPGEPEWQVQRMTALFNEGFESAFLLEQIQALDTGSEVVRSYLADQDWERTWLDQFEPIQVGEDLWVCPSWKEPPHPQATNLIIDPGLAFGTGTHPTTHMCLQYLSSLDLKNSSVMDYGCGSGILAIAALALGATKAIGVDVDPRALLAANENAAINGVSERFSSCLPDQLTAQNFDIVIANILAGTLIQLKQELLSLARPGTLILLSGVLAEQVEMVKSAFSDQLDFNVRQSDDWILLTGWLGK